MNNSNIMIEMIQSQIKETPSDKKLLYNDLKRICKYLQLSIFSDECSLWNGYVTKNDEKNSYINFFFKGKKHALHRLLYVNYIGILLDSEYIKFSCINKGKCCNINHFYKNDKNETKEIKTETSENNIKKNIKPIIVKF